MSTRNVSAWIHPRHLLAGLALAGLIGCGAAVEGGPPEPLAQNEQRAGTSEPTWRYTTPPTQQRVGPATVLLPSGKVLMVGGTIIGSGPTASAELYDPTTDSWSPAGAMSVGRYGMGAAVLSTGKVLVTGGELAGGHGLGTRLAELYDPATGSWSIVTPMTFSRAFHEAAALPNGRALVLGDHNVTELYDSASNTWTVLQPYFWETKGRAHAIPLPNGKVMMVCGEWNEQPQLFDPSLLTWTPTGPMGTLRHACTATLLPSGKVLVTGGRNIPTTQIQASAELYDPQSDTWAPAAPMGQARYVHAAALLSDGKVLVSGGSPEGSTQLRSAEVYDPATDTWQPTASMGRGRGSTPWRLITLPDGHVFVGSDAPELYLSVPVVPACPPEQLGSPTLTVAGALDMTLECGQGEYVDPGATAQDGCGNPLEVHRYNSGQDAYGPGPETDAEGTHSVQYIAWDASGATVSAIRTVRVKDRTAPTLQLKGPSQMTHTCGSAWIDPGVDAMDACYGELSPTVRKSGEVNGWVEGVYTVTYSVTDSGGNSAVPVTRTVEVTGCPW